MWELAACGILTAAGIILTYLFYKDLECAAEISKVHNALDEEVIRASKILNDLQNGKEGKR